MDLYMRLRCHVAEYLLVGLSLHYLILIPPQFQAKLKAALPEV